MKEIKTDLSNVKTGDYVLVLSKGWVPVSCVHANTSYPISTEGLCYALDGRYGKSHEYPSVFSAENLPPELLALYGPPPCVFKKGDKVLVRNEGHTGWNRMYFSYRGDGDFYCFYGGDEWSSNRKTTSWDECKLWKEGDD